jgi:hypothetical protein
LISHDLILNDTLRAQAAKIRAHQENLSDNIYVIQPSSLAPKKLAPKKCARPAHGTRKDSPLLSLSPHFPQSTLKLLFKSQIHNGPSQGTAIEFRLGKASRPARLGPEPS